MCRKIPAFWIPLDHWWKPGKLKRLCSHLSSTPQAKHTLLVLVLHMLSLPSAHWGGISQCLFVYNTNTLDLKQWTGVLLLSLDQSSCLGFPKCLGIDMELHWPTLLTKKNVLWFMLKNTFNIKIKVNQILWYSRYQDIASWTTAVLRDCLKVLPVTEYSIGRTASEFPRNWVLGITK